MTITLRTGSWARKFGLGEHTTLNPTEGAMVEDIIAELTTVPSEEIGPAMINKLAVPRNTALKDGDILEIFPSIIGG